MRIALVLDNMIYGGIERVSIEYMNILLNKGHKVDVYILNPKVEDIVKEIPKECNVKYVKFSKMLCPEAYWIVAKKYKIGKLLFPIIFFALSFLIPILRIFKGTLKEYDTAIAFSGHYNDLTYVSSILKAKRRICWLHGALSGYLLISPGYAFLYKKIKNLVVLSEDYQEEALSVSRLNNCNITKIYNPVVFKNKKQDDKKISHLRNQFGDFALMVGRFSPQKDHLTVVDAIKILREKYDLKLKTIFVGDGPLRENVEKYVKRNNLSDLISFEGTQSDVQSYYKAAKIFLHSSPSEGLPTVLLEALYFGVPIVATDSKPGVREILGDSEYGLICPIKDPEVMADKINQLLSNELLYSNYVQNGYKRIEEFSPEIISQKIEKMFSNLR